MRIEQLMTTPVNSCKPEDTLEHAAQLVGSRLRVRACMCLSGSSTTAGA